MRYALLWLLALAFFLIVLTGTVLALTEGDWASVFVGAAALLVSSWFLFSEPISLDEFIDSEFEDENHHV